MEGIVIKSTGKIYDVLIENKIVKPIIYKTFSMYDVKKAHELMESSKHIGKIVLRIEN